MSYRISKASYYADFFTAPLAAVLALARLMTQPTDAEALASALAIGALAWTLAEYLLHRHVLHVLPAFYGEHMAHHRMPPDYIGVPAWQMLLGFAAAGFGLPAAFGPSIGVGLFVGLLAGYLFYIAVHDAFHHRHASLRPGSLLWRQYRNHAHHHMNARANFGVSSPLWDFVFGTYGRPFGGR